LNITLSTFSMPTGDASSSGHQNGQRISLPSTAGQTADLATAVRRRLGTQDQADPLDALELALRVGQGKLLDDAIAQDVEDPASPESRRPLGQQVAEDGRFPGQVVPAELGGVLEALELALQDDLDVAPLQPFVS
jgi:hypothetical protein